MLSDVLTAVSDWLYVLSRAFLFYVKMLKSTHLLTCGRSSLFAWESGICECRRSWSEARGSTWAWALCEDFSDSYRLSLFSCVRPAALRSHVCFF